jgi:hypothetical protein
MLEDSGPAVQPCGRCGHDPEAPRWFAPPEEHPTRPTSWTPGRCSVRLRARLRSLLARLAPPSLPSSSAFPFAPAPVPPLRADARWEARATALAAGQAAASCRLRAGRPWPRTAPFGHALPAGRPAAARPAPSSPSLAARRPSTAIPAFVQRLILRLGAFQQARLRLEQAESPHQGPVQTPRPR